MSEAKRKSRALHFAEDYSGETACGKQASRTRMTRFLATWDNPMYAQGRRCEQCRPVVEQVRTKKGAKS